MRRWKHAGPIMIAILLASCTAERQTEVSPDLTFPKGTDSEQPENETTDQFVSSSNVKTIADNLNVPWDMAVSHDGTIYFTERAGLLRVIRDGKHMEEPLLSLEDSVESSGEGGLLGIALDPKFEQNRYLYVYHTYRENNTVMNRVLRLKETDKQVEVDQELISGIPGGLNHNGGRIRFGPDGLLYITTGDRYEPELAQDVNSLGGKILRLNADGSVPASNPFPNSPVYSYGHRNPQGLAWHPETGQLYASEHGQSAHDEINQIEAGVNYGWPLIQGDEAGASGAEQMMKPFLHSGEDTWAPSGIAFASSGSWKGKLLIACLRGENILSMTLSADHTAVSGVEPLFSHELGRIRNIYEAPDGTWYLMTNNRDGRGEIKRDDDKLIQIIPDV